tara:strand:+ start:210 stop:542 length:333 start_codon:yes stop_codon:yes gene_type:complete
MPTKEMYKKYEANQTKDKVVDSSAGGLFKGEHFDGSNPSGKLYFEHPSQEQINEMVAASHKPITSYEDMPESIKSKPSVDSSALTPNVSYLEAVGATQKPGDRKYGAQDD